MDHQRLLECVPVGRDNALSSRSIWHIVDLWAEVTVANYLAKMHRDGLICRDTKTIYCGPMHVWWRNPMDDYDKDKDLSGSIELGLRTIRERVAAGGRGWERGEA